MGTLRDLYLRVSAAIEGAHPSVKADVDSAFADHEAASTEPAAPKNDAVTDDTAAIRDQGDDA